jgi:hypothetical protein
MSSGITNIYNKKTKGPTLMEFFTATGKLEMFHVCTTGDTAHIDTIFKLLPHTRQHVDACVASFPVAVKNSIKVGPLVFLL